MSTTSNSRVDAFFAALFALLVGACAGNGVVSPEAPREALRTSDEVPVRRGPPRDAMARLEPASASLLRGAAADELLRRLPPVPPEAAGDITVLELRLIEPLPPPIFDALPVIVLNGQPLPRTVTIDPQRLAVAVTRRQLRDTNSVGAAWLGAEEETTSRNPVTVRLQ